MALKKSQLYSSLWRSCDELRGGMDASKYKDHVLTLLFMKYVSDLVRHGLVMGIIGLPPNLFYGTGIPACIVVIDTENAHARRGILWSTPAAASANRQT